MKRKLLATVLIVLPLSAYAQVYKCEIDGRTIYRDFPCPSGEVITPKGNISVYHPSDVRSSFGNSSSNSSSSPSRSVDRPPSESQTNTITRNDKVRAHAEGRLIPGMSENMAITILGVPDHTSTYRRSDGVECERFYWPDPRFVSGRHRATICDGKVFSYDKY